MNTLITHKQSAMVPYLDAQPAKSAANRQSFVAKTGCATPFMHIRIRHNENVPSRPTAAETVNIRAASFRRFCVDIVRHHVPWHKLSKIAGKVSRFAAAKNP